MKRRLLIISLPILAALLVTGGVALGRGLASQNSAPASLEPSVGTAFTYQGRLNQAGDPGDGNFDFEFRLFDAANNGNQVGDVVALSDVPVVDGLFTEQLNFGVGVFNGDARWLEISVRPGAEAGDHTLLDPRQPLTPAPYAFALPGLFTIPNDTSPNIVGGHNGNIIVEGVVGATISGGGAPTDAPPIPVFPDSNIVSDSYGTVSGGSRNRAGDQAGGVENATYATVSGGGANRANATGSTVGGGINNQADETHSTVGGGFNNQANGFQSVISGGSTNQTNGGGATVAGGQNNQADAFAATVGGGRDNEVQGSVGTIGGGGKVTVDFGGGPLTFEGNRVTSVGGTIGGGSNNLAGNNDNNFIFPDFPTVGGGADNRAMGSASTIGGGGANTASGDSSTVAGGQDNEATADGATIGGGGEAIIDLGEGDLIFGGNRVYDIGGTIGGGSENIAGTDDGNTEGNSYGTVGGGRLNVASGESSTVAGGVNNQASGFISSIGGGEDNSASRYGFVGGGRGNNAGAFAAIGGGVRNQVIGGNASVIGGGEDNIVEANKATIGGGEDNVAEADLATIAGGGSDFDGPVEDAPFIGNRVFDHHGTVGGGANNQAGSDNGDPDDAPFATVGAGFRNTAAAEVATVAGGGAVQFEFAPGEFHEPWAGNRALDVGATVGGGSGNVAGNSDEDPFSGGRHSTVGGGRENSATNTGSVVAGGELNISEGIGSTVGGGTRHNASGNGSTIAGGEDNIASGTASTVGGGRNNVASAFGAVVPGGFLNVAGGNTSFASGARAIVDETHPGTFLFASGNSADFNSEAGNEFAVRATGGFRFVSGVAIVSSIAAGSTRQVETAGTVDMMWTMNTANRLAHVVASFPPSGANTIEFDSSSSESVTINGSSLTFSHTVADNNDRMLIVGTTAESTGDADCGVTGVTYDGVVLSKADEAETGLSILQCASLWYLASPVTGTNDVVISWSASLDNRNGGAVSLYNVSQGGPEATATGTEDPAGTQITTSITTLTDDAWLVDVVGSGNQATEFVVGSDQTERYIILGVTDTSITTGCTIASGSSAINCPGGFQQLSDRNAKINFSQIDGRGILELLGDIPIESWNYKGVDSSVRHIGPMAQDFYAAFGLGTGDKQISTIDADGVALAAIQGLHEIVKEKETQITHLQAQNDELEGRLTRLEQAVTVDNPPAGLLSARMFVTWGLMAGVAALTLLYVLRRRMGESR